MHRRFIFRSSVLLRHCHGRASGHYFHQIYFKSSDLYNQFLSTSLRLSTVFYSIFVETMCTSLYVDFSGNSRFLTNYVYCGLPVMHGSAPLQAHPRASVVHLPNMYSFWESTR
ncbi:hypothetical protein K439DRAFT_550069 [Ramaria rubella]|nr:hypothetical protein K439DRAFT_550069 [Ramaria rubella]